MAHVTRTQVIFALTTFGV